MTDPIFVVRKTTSDGLSEVSRSFDPDTFYDGRDRCRLEITLPFYVARGLIEIANLAKKPVSTIVLDTLMDAEITLSAKDLGS